MNALIDQILEVSVWGIMPVFLAFIMIFCTLIVKFNKMEEGHPLEEITSKKKFHKVERIYSRVDCLSEIFLFIGITLAILPFVVAFDARYETYISIMMTKIEVVSSITVGLTTISITMAMAVILFDKGYYIVFSIREVLQKYKFTEVLVVVIISCLLVTGITPTMLNLKLDSTFDVVRFLILEIAAIYNFLGVAYILGVIINIMFLDRRGELTLLGQLYRRFWVSRVDTTSFKAAENWSKEVVAINVEYLIERYIDICKKKKVERIKRVEFVTTMDCYKEKWYCSARRKFIKMILIFLIVSLVVDSVAFGTEGVGIVGVNIATAVFSIILACANVKSFRFVVMRFFSDTWGYYICTYKDKELLIPRVALRKSNTYDKYIMTLNSLIAFFHIWINYTDVDKEVLESQFKEIISALGELENKGMITYLPVFTIGFFLFNKHEELEILKSIYGDVVKHQKLQYDFERMLHSQVFYLTRKYNGEIFQYSDSLKKYIDWLKV